MDKKVKVERRRARRPGRISTKHQVTIPVAQLEEAGPAPGDEAEFVVTSPGRIEVRRPRSRFENVIGTVPRLEDYVDIDQPRNEWER